MTANAQAGKPSLTAAQQRFVSVVKQLERAPLDPNLKDDRAWAVRWLVAAPDLTISVCADSLGGVLESKYVHADMVVVQYMLAMGAYILENPGRVNDLDAQQLAGVESALNAYRAIRAAQSDQQSPALENLLALQGKGELAAFVKQAYRQCLAEGGN